MGHWFTGNIKLNSWNSKLTGFQGLKGEKNWEILVREYKLLPVIR